MQRALMHTRLLDRIMLFKCNSQIFRTDSTPFSRNLSECDWTKVDFYWFKIIDRGANNAIHAQTKDKFKRQ